MKKKQEVWIYKGAVILLGLLVLGGIAFASGVFSWANVEQEVAQLLADKIGAPAIDETPLGAMPGSDLPGPGFSVNGIQMNYANVGMMQATTTLCSIKNPSNATSTLTDFRFTIVKGTSTDATLTIATSSKQYSTSSTLTIGGIGISANQIANYVATSTSLGVGTPPYTYPVIIMPNEYVLLKVSTGYGLNGYTYIGGCQAIFEDFLRR